MDLANIRYPSMCAPGGLPFLPHVIILSICVISGQILRVDALRNHFEKKYKACHRSKCLGRHHLENNIPIAEVSSFNLPLTKRERDALERDAYCNHACPYICFPWRSISETFDVPIVQWVTLIGIIAIVSETGVCFTRPHYVMLSLVFGNAFMTVAWTKWTTQEHRIAAMMISLIVLGMSNTLALTFLMHQNGPDVAYALMALQMVFVIVFVGRAAITWYIQQNKSQTYSQIDECRKALAKTCGRNPLVVIEYANFAVLIAVMILVRAE